MLARLCQHIPPPGFHLTRLYGAYANRTRGARARRGSDAGHGRFDQDDEPDALTASQRERRRQWARLIAKVFEVDLLRCPCGGAMRVMAFILDPAVIPQDPAAPAPHRGAGARSAARLRSLTRNAVPWRVRGRLGGGVCLRGGARAHPIPWQRPPEASTVGRAAG
jgi:hypothetical protein